MEIPFKWIGQACQHLEQEIRDELDFVEDANGLIFHTHFLSDDMDGPTVSVYGQDGCFVAEYHAETEWVALITPTQTEE